MLILALNIKFTDYLLTNLLTYLLRPTYLSRVILFILKQ